MQYASEHIIYVVVAVSESNDDVDVNISQVNITICFTVLYYLGQIASLPWNDEDGCPMSDMSDHH